MAKAVRVAIENVINMFFGDSKHMTVHVPCNIPICTFDIIPQSSAQINLFSKPIMFLDYNCFPEKMGQLKLIQGKFLTDLFNAMYDELPAPKPKKKK